MHQKLLFKFHDDYCYKSKYFLLLKIKGNLNILSEVKIMKLIFLSCPLRLFSFDNQLIFIYAVITLNFRWHFILICMEPYH